MIIAATNKYVISPPQIILLYNPSLNYMKHMKKITLSFATLLITVFAFAQNWNADKNHSKLGFEVTHLLVTDVDGYFKSFDIALTSSKDDFTDAVVTVTADISSINTDNDYRDNDLKSDKYFDAAKFPTLNFKSTSMQKIDAKNYKLSGNLTLHGVTKPVVLNLTLNGSGINPMNKKPVAGFKIKGTIKRTDFGIGSATPSAIVSDDVDIIANVEVDKG
jgi:polyisoprenoid-binding protein YceI